MMYCSDVCVGVSLIVLLTRCVTDSATDTVVQYGDECRSV
jgi:hypothetical protein